MVLLTLKFGVNNEGEIQYLKNKYYQDNGCSKNENTTLMTLGHMHNCYNSKRWHVEAYSVLTDTPSTTWCRAPGNVNSHKIEKKLADQFL